MASNNSLPDLTNVARLPLRRQSATWKDKHGRIGTDDWLLTEPEPEAEFSIDLLALSLEPQQWNPSLQIDTSLNFTDYLSFTPPPKPQILKQLSQAMDDKWISTESNDQTSIEVKSPMFIDNTDFTIPTPAHIRLEMSRNFCNNI